MTVPPTGEAVAAAQRLETSVNQLTDEARALRTYGQRNRKLIHRSNLALAMVAALTVAVGVLAWLAIQNADRASQAASAARTNQVALYAACQFGNQSRSRDEKAQLSQVDLLAGVLDAARPPRPTPQSVAFFAKTSAALASTRHQIIVAQRPRDCGHDPNRK